MRPPFKITNKIFGLCAEIAKVIGQYQGIRFPTPQPKLRRQNQLKTIHESLAIEGNSLNLGQVTDILEGRQVVGDPRKILEVRSLEMQRHSLNLLLQQFTIAW